MEHVGCTTFLPLESICLRKVDIILGRNERQEKHLKVRQRNTNGVVLTEITY